MLRSSCILVSVSVGMLGVVACTSTGAPAPGEELLPDGGLAPPRIHQYLRASPFPRLVLEVDAVPGFEPRASSQADLVSALSWVLAKPDGIEVTADEAVLSKGTDHAWTLEELNALATATWTLTVPANTTKMHVLYLDGHSADDSANGSVLGVAWGGRNIAMFKQTLEGACTGGLNAAFGETLCERAERAVWIHEVGHLLGLVDNGLPMVTPHRDPETSHGRHDANQACVMYWAYEGEAILDVLRDELTSGGSAVPQFDAQCLQDVAAVRDAP